MAGLRPAISLRRARPCIPKRDARDKHGPDDERHSIDLGIVADGSCRARPCRTSPRPADGARARPRCRAGDSAPRHRRRIRFPRSRQTGDRTAGPCCGRTSAGIDWYHSSVLLNIGIDIEDDAAKRKDPVTNHLADRELGDAGLVHGATDSSELRPRARRVPQVTGIVTLASLITLPHSAVSSAKNFAASAGRPDHGIELEAAQPLVDVRASQDLDHIAIDTGRQIGRHLRRAGHREPGDGAEPGKPDSAMVGNSLSDSTRSGLATATILILSLRNSGTAVVTVSKKISICPAMRSLIAGAAPR